MQANSDTGHMQMSLPAVGGVETRLAEIEQENRRLQKLVAELLMKNHHLREREARLAAGSPDGCPIAALGLE